jgi:hypothetical protein
MNILSLLLIVSFEYVSVAGLTTETRRLLIISLDGKLNFMLKY